MQVRRGEAGSGHGRGPAAVPHAASSGAACGGVGNMAKYLNKANPFMEDNMQMFP